MVRKKSKPTHKFVNLDWGWDPKPDHLEVNKQYGTVGLWIWTSKSLLLSNWVVFTTFYV